MILHSVPVTALVWAMSFFAYFVIVQFGGLVDRSWRQRAVSVALLLAVVLCLGTGVKAAYMEDSDHTYYCMAWSWWPWSGC